MKVFNVSVNNANTRQPNQVVLYTMWRMFMKELNMFEQCNLFVLIKSFTTPAIYVITQLHKSIVLKYICIQYMKKSTIPAICVTTNLQKSIY